MKKKLAVIGTGTAGIQSLCHFLGYTTSEWEVTSIYNPTIKIVGIGESTNPSFLEKLGIGIDFDYTKDLHHLDGSIKIGTKFFKWRDYDFLNPLIYDIGFGFGLTKYVAIHFNNFKLQEFVFGRLREKWNNRFQEVHGNVDELIDGDGDVRVIVDGTEHIFDYVIDCRGWPKDFTNYHVIEQAPVNHAIIHSVEEFETFEWTGHRATVDGWMFEIPLATRLTYGYLFHDEITSIEQAKINFSKEINVPVNELSNIEYKFKSYYAKEPLGKRVMKNGNTAVFFEPMSANSLWSYDIANRLFFDYAVNGQGTIDHVNQAFVMNSKAIEEIIYFYYHGGSIYDTPFWKRVVAYTKDYIENHSHNFKNTQQAFIELRPELAKDPLLLAKLNKPNWIFGPVNLVMIDHNFGYNYFLGD